MSRQCSDRYRLFRRSNTTRGDRIEKGQRLNQERCSRKHHQRPRRRPTGYGGWPFGGGRARSRDGQENYTIDCRQCWPLLSTDKSGIQGEKDRLTLGHNAGGGNKMFERSVGP